MTQVLPSTRILKIKYIVYLPKEAIFPVIIGKVNHCGMDLGKC